MNKRFFALAILLSVTFALSARAETTVSLSDVHLCCKSCVKGVASAVGKVQGATVACDADAKTVTVSAPDAGTAQKAVDALVAGGYFGKSSNAAVKVNDISGAKDGKVNSLTVSGVHLCCGKCVTTVTKALETVKGVSGNTAEKNATSFEVTGDFNPKEVFTALQAEGLTGKAGK